MNVAVGPEDRRKGTGRALLTALLERLEDDAQITLEVRRTNAGAIALYESFGFRAAGVRRRYYQDNGEDALILWRTPGTLRGTLDDVPAADPRAALDPR
jgi:ribosomal-protein-alanine N-acetyltransferase